ncbi:hypothetical protein [Pedobacter nutrimenti]|uniref:hypothetical protein n=1 Tax=Pedobacter nutrimenti TaxID=1241337 RepID=UPI0029318A1F|nr:hypothetical protein [Pedobacter nutrimenti]
MKKLKLNKAAFAGAEVLSRAQLKKVIGGTGGTCTMTYTTPNNSSSQTVSYSVGGTCAEQSSSMKKMCVDNITVGLFASCKYDCGCDGWGS